MRPTRPGLAHRREMGGKRKDTLALAPVKRATREFALAAATSSESRSQAVEQYQRDKVASLAAATMDGLLSTWIEFHTAWFGSDADWLPLTLSAFVGVAAMFKSGRYRSFPNYLSRAKKAHIAAGFAWTEQLELEARKGARSVLRGIGPSR